MSAIVLRGDARNIPLEDNTVDLIITSPPYFGLRSYTDGGEHYDGQIGSEATPGEYVAALVGCTAEWVRVLKPSGSLFVNLGDKYSQYEGERKGHGRSFTGPDRPGRGEPLAMPVSAPQKWGIANKSLMGLPWRYALAACDQLGLILRAEIIWAKPNGLPESVTDRVRRAHEQVFHFTVRPRYYSAVDEIREPHTGNSHAPGKGVNPHWSAFGLDKRTGRQRTDPAEFNPLGKLPGSVWAIPSQPLTVPPALGVDHFAAFPMELPRRIIAGWSPPGGIIADPFGGTGTTALLAHALGRHGISVDRSADYCRLAAWRTTDPAERARALEVPKPPPVPEGMDALF